MYESIVEPLLAVILAPIIFLMVGVLWLLDQLENPTKENHRG
jgi:hypothetical protein